MTENTQETANSFRNTEELLQYTYSHFKGLYREARGKFEDAKISLRHSIQVNFNQTHCQVDLENLQKLQQEAIHLKERMLIVKQELCRYRIENMDKIEPDQTIQPLSKEDIASMREDQKEYYLNQLNDLHV